MKIDRPEPKTALVIDFEITLVSGKTIDFTLCPYLGDTIAPNETHTVAFFARTSHDVTVTNAQVAVFSRRERTITLLPDTLDPKAAASER